MSEHPFVPGFPARHMIRRVCENSRSRSARRGFSLVEVSIALGIMAFALVGIMALFPTALRSARESQQETRATFIARQIFADLNASESPTNALIAVGDSLTNPTHRTNVNLAQNSTNAVLYNEDGLPLNLIAPVTLFTNNIPAGPDGTYAVRIGVSTNDLPPGLSRVEVLVTAPAAAALTNRAQFPFITLLRNR